MKIVFRVAYHTVPGQSLWLKLAVISPPEGTRVESWFPMNWLNLRQWQMELDLSVGSMTRIEYHYQLRQENNGLHLDEWDAPRTRELDPARWDCVLLEDTWCSAGTVDHVLGPAGFSTPHTSTAAPDDTGDHTFSLFMASVPAHAVPCLSGSHAALGGWDPDHVIPLAPTAPDVWETSVALPADTHIEYKYGLMEIHNHRLISLEEGDNRFLEPHLLAARQRTVIHDEGYRHPTRSLPRAAGVAIPVFSLRSDTSLGTGEFADLKPFADWAARAGLQLIQILPVNDTTSSHDWTDSYPYSAISAFALHPIYLRLEELSVDLTKTEIGEIAKARVALNPLPQLDHPAVTKVKTDLLRRVFRRHAKSLMKRSDILTFVEENHAWLPTYAAFCMLRDRSGTADFSQWGDAAVFTPQAVTDVRDPDPEGFFFHLWLQFELDLQLRDAVAHLHSLGIRLKGDLPIGIDRKSAEAWSMPHLFHMDRQAGAPPDAFAEKGQNWGFPTYDWDAMAADGYAWWQSRFTHLSRYFDAFRIDHILGFFRIWQIPADQIDGIMGAFEPALPIHIGEIRARGIPFEIPRFCQPYLRESTLRDLLGNDFKETCGQFLEPTGRGGWRLRDHVSTQRKIADHFSTLDHTEHSARIRGILMELAAEVLFFEVPGSNGTLFHPRCALQSTHTYLDLDPDVRERVDDLYHDYFHRRQDDFWQACGYAKLPAMRKASTMLLCGEDLGMVPECVPGVMRELGILSLEIQRMPKSHLHTYANPALAPYLSVVSTSTHDMTTLRGWWREDPRATSEFARDCLGIDFPPHELSGDLARRIIHQHLASPAMWAVFPLQDLLAIDESLRHPDPDAERINIPAITPYFWRYRMHLSIEELLAADSFNSLLHQLVAHEGRGVHGA